MAPKKTVRKGGWTATQRKMVSALIYPHKSDPKGAFPTAEAAWAKVSELAGQEGAMPTALDEEKELARYGLLRSRHQGHEYIKSITDDFNMWIVGFWTANGWLDFAAKTAVTMGHDRDQGWRYFAALRRSLYAATEEEFQSARAIAAPVYKKWGDDWTEVREKRAEYTDAIFKANEKRGLVAFAFSRDPSWARELLTSVLDNTTAKRKLSIPYRGRLLASVDKDLALRAAQYKKVWSYPAEWVFDIVEAHGSDAVPIFEALIAHGCDSRTKKPLQSALKLAAKLADFEPGWREAEAGGDAAAPIEKTAPAQKKKAAPSGLPLPESLTAPWAGAGKTKKPKKPKKVAPLHTTVSIHVPEERERAHVTAEAAKQYGDDEATRKQADGYYAEPRLYLFSGNREVMNLSPPARLAWLREADKKLLAMTMRDRNAFSVDQLIDGFILPFGEHAAEVEALVLLAKPDLFVDLAPLLSSPAIAERMAEVAAGKKGSRRAKAWLAGNVELALVGVIPAAVNTGGKKQGAYLAALELLREASPETFDQVLGEYGEPARGFVLGLLDAPDAGPQEPKTLPPFWKPAALPTLVHTSGEDLPADIVQNVGKLMKASPAGEPMEGLTALVAATTPESRAPFARALVEAWDKGGADTKERWPVTWAGLLGGDAVVAELRERSLNWANQNAHQRAFWAVESLSGVGTNSAAEALWRLSKESPFDGLKARALEGVAAVAKTRGLEREELLDELVPDLGLKLGEKLDLDFGPRTLAARINGRLEVEVRDEEGKVLKNLPKPRKSDDGDKAEAALSRVRRLKVSLRSVAKDQAKRFELALVEERRWTAERFNTYVFTHPVISLLARGLVWARLLGKTPTLFRIDESFQPVDLDDNPVDLSEGAITLAHPATMSAEQRERWGQCLADYEILPPFQQLDRPWFDLEAATAALDQVAGIKVGSGRLRGIRRRGWTYGEAEDAGLVCELHKRVRTVNGTKSTAVLRFEHGLPRGGTDFEDTQELLALKVGEPRELTTVALSEVVTDVKSLSN